MKKTIDISIGGFYFCIDSDAYEILEQYLLALHDRYKDRGAEGKEITTDIEIRIAELILSQQKEVKSPIGIQCIQEVLSIMGSPYADTDDLQNEKQTMRDSTPKIPKRLYRNTEGSKLGGVFKGIATYFNIDVVTFRLLYVLSLILFIVAMAEGRGSLAAFSAFSFFFLLMLYLLLWIIVPVAVTARQKLEMSGGGITVNSIETIFENEMNKKREHPKNKETASLLTNLAYVIGRTFRFALHAFLSVFSVCIAVMGLLVIVAAIYALTSAQGLLTILTDGTPVLVVVVASLSIVVPIAFLLTLFISILFKVRVYVLTYILLIVSWIGLWVVSGVGITRIIADNNARGEVLETTITASTDTLYVKIDQQPWKIPSYSNGRYQFGLEDDYILSDACIYISQDKNAPQGFVVNTVRYSLGSSVRIAEKNAATIDVRCRQDGDTLFIPSCFVIDKSKGFHGQRFDVKINMSSKTTLFISPQAKKLLCRYDNDRKFVYNSRTGYYERTTTKK